MRPSRILPFVILALVACSDDPIEPGPVPLSDALVDALTREGMASARVLELPGGAGRVFGPNGVQLEVVAKEFVQQVTLPNDPPTVLRTSGISLVGVPVDGEDAPFATWRTGAANTGSLESIAAGESFDIVDTGELEIDFQRHVRFGHASVADEDRNRDRADVGFIRIDRVTYETTDAPCESPPIHTHLVLDVCTIRLGTVEGTVEFSIALEDGGTLVQERVDFEVPLIREEIVARVTPSS